MTQGLTRQTQNDAFIKGLVHHSPRSRNPVKSFRPFANPQDVSVHPVNPPLRDAALPGSGVVERTSASLDIEHASPLTPLRQRDARALDEFFKDERIQEITLDIHRNLARMYPEPCWEDEPYDFLHGYI